VVESTIHMHYLGRAGYIKHYRGNTKMTDMVIQDLYSYDVPQFQEYSSPVEVQPGDHFSVECVFKSTSRSDYTFYGDSTQQEMCFGFLVYYPAIPTFTQCLKYTADADVCPDVAFEMNGCDLNNFPEGVGIYTDLVLSCDTTGETCTSSCQTKLTQYAADYPCMRDPALAQTKEYLGEEGGSDSIDVINAINSCLLPPETTSDTDSGDDTGVGGLLCGAMGAGEGVKGYLVLFLGLAALLLGN